MKTQHLAAGLAALLISLSFAAAQGTTAFTYQGRFNTNGAPYTGSAEFQFTLWDATAAGNAVATNNPANLIATVTDGLFTVTLDFGVNPFNGQPRFLQIEARTAIGPFTALSPRQPVTATPYALRALNLTTNGLAPGTYGNAVMFDNAANSFAGAFAGTVSGNGAGLTSVNAATLNGLTSAGFWKTNGNAGANPGNNFLGTTDNQPLEIRVNNMRSLRIEPADYFGFFSPNLIGGYVSNYVAPGVAGATIGGGGFADNSNRVTGIFGTVGGGFGNIATGSATVGGGGQNSATNDSATVSGGFGNVASGPAASVGGGAGNEAVRDYSAVGGGSGNHARGVYSSIGGGSINEATNAYATVNGGHGNTAGATNAAVGGGFGNRAVGESTTVAGGENNTASGFRATVGGGSLNLASGNYATVSGGSGNIAAGFSAAVAGGDDNIASGNYSFAAGHYARATNTGAFVWADSTTPGLPAFTSTAPNQFLIRASGGVQLDGATTSLFCGNTVRQMLNLWGTEYGIGVQTATLYNRSASGFDWFRGGSHSITQDDPGAGGLVLMRLDANGNLYTRGAVNPTSDRNAKTNFACVNGREVLERLAAMPVQTWNYKEDLTARHIGPMAQDFYAAFGVGPDDKHIATVDADGVALAAIQGLNQKVTEELKRRDAENAELKQRLEALERILRNQKFN